MAFTKVCGITNPEDGRVAAAAGAEAVGLTFAESPRRGSFEEAREVGAALPEGALTVGMFVDEEPEEVLRVVREVWCGTTRNCTAKRGVAYLPS